MASELPHIDPRVHYVGVSKLRQFTAAKLKADHDLYVFQDGDEPLRVLVPWDVYQSMQAVIKGQR